MLNPCHIFKQFMTIDESFPLSGKALSATPFFCHWSSPWWSPAHIRMPWKTAADSSSRPSCGSLHGGPISFSQQMLLCPLWRWEHRAHLHWDEQDGGIPTNSVAASLYSPPSVRHTLMRDGGGWQVSLLVDILAYAQNIRNILLSQPQSSSQKGALTSRLNDILPETWL